MIYDKIFKKGVGNMVKILDREQNPKQYCIENIKGKYFVLAGPGTGKTYTVIKRLQKMIKQGVNPEKILCLTYTVAAANEMKKRVLEQLDENNNNIEIYTYHSFCNKIMNEYSDEFDLPDNFRVIPTTIQKALIKECIDEKQDVKFYKSSKADPYTHVKSITDGIKALKNQRITTLDILTDNINHNPEWKHQIDLLTAERNTKPNPRKNYEANIQKVQDKIDKMYELFGFYQLYKEKMEMQGYIDFEDMINNILEKFETSQAFAETIANNYEYIIVDEYQDTNKSQNELIFHLVDNMKTGNVFVVGDDEQIVNASQGARLDSIDTFKNKYPDIEEIVFHENRRSTQTILDVARTVADQSPVHIKNLDRTLKAVNEDVIKKNKKVRLNIYTSLTQQYNDIVKEIDELMISQDAPRNKNGERDFSQVAILSTNNDELAEFAKLLHNRNIPYELKEGKNIFEIKSVIILFYYLQTLVNPELYADKLFKLLMLPPFNIDPQAFLKLYQRISNHKSFIDTMESFEENESTEEIKRFLNTYKELKTLSEGETVFRTVTQCAAKTGILDFFLNFETNRLENILGLQALLNEASAFSSQYKKVTLEEFIDYLEMASQDGIKAEKESDNMNAVQLSTYQSSKGREFEVVYMPTLQSSKWESNSRPVIKPSVPVAYDEYKTKEEWEEFKTADKINKLYVGMTRAKHTLRLSYCIGDGSATHTKFLKIAELPRELIEVNAFEKNESEELIAFAKQAWVMKDYDYKREFKSRMDDVLEDKNYSPTFVNEYIKCPRMFFYNQILNLSPASGIADAASFGSAVHKACEDATKYALENGKYYDDAQPFIESFMEELARQPLSSYQLRTHYEEFGTEKLKDYFENKFSKIPVENIYAAEKKIETEFEGVNFKGYIDRIDIVNDKLQIFDYKTGKAKDEEEICIGGKHQDYYMQMGLYKYFLEKTEGKKIAKTEFIFPQEYKKPFTIDYTEDMINEILDKYRNAIKGIKSHEFEPTPCPNSCRYCPYNGDICDLAE